MASAGTMKRESVIEENPQAVKEDIHLEGIETDPIAEKAEDVLKNARGTWTDTGIETEIETDITNTAMMVRQHK